ncbi:MAG: M15 family metallopeptidase [Chitinophagaceae bacterium]
MKFLQLGSSGNDVRRWQTFLTGQGLFTEVINAVFDEATKLASQAFQAAHGLEPDGKVGDKTIGAAMMLGFGVVTDDSVAKDAPNWPPKPNFPPLTSNAERAAIFGKFAFKSKPLPGSPENIEVTDSWAKDNIVMAMVPQLIAIKGSDKVSFHKKGKAQLEKMWSDWEKAGLLHLVLTWSGSYVPRFIRGSRTILSNHSFGTAFDINVPWNMLGTVPALVGRKGSVRELVAIANQNGFYWGGHFSRQDGMHFEVAKVK